jgi:hypothetical protein
VTAKRIKVADVPLRRKAGTKLRKAALFKQLGPGLVTGPPMMSRAASRLIRKLAPNSAATCSG